MQNLNFVVVFFSCLAGLIVSFFLMFDTTDYNATAVFVTTVHDSSYFNAHRTELTSGFLASLFGSIVAYLMRVNFLTLLVCLLITGLIFPGMILLEDFESWEYFPSNIIEFLTPFMLSSFLLVAVLFIINLKFKRI